jgi:putative MATE family efflux protein
VTRDGTAAGHGDRRHSYASFETKRDNNITQFTDPANTRSLGGAILDGLKGVRHDYTKGSIWRAIIVLSVPMVIEMSMQSVFEVADIFFVGKLGSEAVAAVGLTASLIILVFAVGLGFAMAASAMVARRIGEDDEEGAARATGQAVLACLATSLPIGILAIFFAPDLLALMGAGESVIEIGSGYTAILIGGNITIILLFTFNAVFRGAGDPGLAMKALALANILNIALDPILIFGLGPIPAMGVEGAAIATTIGRSVGVLYQIQMLRSGKSRIVLRGAHFAYNSELMARLVNIAWPAVLQYMVGTASWMAIMRMMAIFGSVSMAGYTIAIRIIIFALLPSWGVSNAAATMVGQSLGAGDPDRGETAVKLCTIVDVVFLSSLGLIFWLFAAPIISIFSSEPGVVDIGTRTLRIMSLSFPLWAIGMVTVQSFNGAGDTRTPTWINLFAYWIIQLPLAAFLAWPLAFHEDGIFAAMAVAQVVLGILAWILFRRGRWRTISV